MVWSEDGQFSTYLEIGVGEDNADPLQTLVDILGKGRCDGGRDGECDEW